MLAGVEVVIHQDGKTPTRANTNAEGIYQFKAVDTGLYYIEVMPPNGLEFTERNKKGPGLFDVLDSDVDQSGRPDMFQVSISKEEYQEGKAREGLDGGLIQMISKTPIPPISPNADLVNQKRFKPGGDANAPHQVGCYGGELS